MTLNAAIDIHATVSNFIYKTCNMTSANYKKDVYPFVSFVEKRMKGPPASSFSGQRPGSLEIFITVPEFHLGKYRPNQWFFN